MLPQELKTSIQQYYRQVVDSRNLIPRYGQRQMIAEIARSLGVLFSDEEQAAPICVVEAGTGTGKTLAYLLAVLPLAQKLDLKVVVATASVALQEQVLHKDIPELKRGSDLDFSVALAKGRGRYLCLSKLDMLLQGNDSLQALLDLYGETAADQGPGNSALYESMMQALVAGDWQGDRDSWETVVSDADWRPLTVDNAQCSGPKCSHFRRCCFYRARESLESAQCIVTNHDLVLSDLSLGGGVILPPPHECLYVFDEAHHLPQKSNQHFASFTRVRGSRNWLERSEPLLGQLMETGFVHREEVESLKRLLGQGKEELSRVQGLLEATVAGLADLDRYDNRGQHTFELGRLPAELQQQSQDLAQTFTRLAQKWEDLADAVKHCLTDGSKPDKQVQAEQWFPALGSHAERARGSLRLWSDFAATDPDGRPPCARWLSFLDADSEPDFLLSASPVLAADNLQSRLWETCAGAVLTSATLSALGRFDTLAMRAGLPERTHFVSIPSPFDFANKAKLVVPRLGCDPSDPERHTQALIRAIPQLLSPDCAALMLFSSRRQMQDVLAAMPEAWRERILCQDDYQKAQLISCHRQRIDRGEGSLIFGLASFAEGVDLPGKYCRHVLIARIPFAVPNDPVEKTLAAWVEQQGENAFMTLAVPDAAFRLLQACGRLLRSERDSGVITIFDERLVHRRYGQRILDALPPYGRELLEKAID